jgi:hypothetical protein
MPLTKQEKDLIAKKEKLVKDVLKLQQHELYLVKNVLEKYKVKLTVNSSGVRANITELDEPIIDEIMGLLRGFDEEKKTIDDMKSTINPPT